MKTLLIVVGKTTNKHIESLISDYIDRLKYFNLSFSLHTIPEIRNNKNMSQMQIKDMEGNSVIKLLNDNDWVVLLDEHGQEKTSMEMAEWMRKKMNASIKRLVFVIGGAYGFSDDVYQRANEKLSLSKMTFSHQMVRLFFVEQLYRSMTILNNLPYHHE